MRITLLFFLSLYSAVGLSQQNQNSSDDFHRLLIVNAKQELMVVKIKNTDFWVTPGLYESHKYKVNSKLLQLAKDYGLQVSNPVLNGVFKLENRTLKKTTHRHFYTVRVNSYKSKTPENIETIEWLPLEDALTKITFPHISLLIKQIMNHPETPWKASVVRYKEGDQYIARLTKEFQPLIDDK